MSLADVKQASPSGNTHLFVPILLLVVLLIIAVLRAPTLISSEGIGSAIIVAAPLILATYALTIMVMAGRVGVDLSIGPLLGFINVGMIQLFAAGVLTSPFDFFAYAIAVGVLYQILMGLIIVYVRVQPIIVALSGFLALVGLNLVILPRPGGLAPEWLMPWGLGTSILSPVLAILVLATIAWFILARTAFFGHLRLMGADERTAYSAGVKIGIVRIGAHVIAGVYSALAAITFTALIGSGDPTQGSTYTLMAVTALVLGGTSLAGGRGTIIGSLLGALNIYLITYVLSTFNFGMVQSFVTELAYGVVLVISLLLTLVLPRLPLGVRSISPFAFFVVLGVVALGVILHAKDEIIAPAMAPTTSEYTVLGADTGASTDSGLTVLGAEPDSSGLTVLGAEPDSSGLTVLGAEPDNSGLTVLGAEPKGSSKRATSGTPLVIAAVIIAVVLFLLYLLYLHASVPMVAFIGVIILLVLGVTLYDRPGPVFANMGKAASAALGFKDTRATGVFELEVADSTSRAHVESIFGPAKSVFNSPLANWLLVPVGAVLVGTLLIVVFVHRAPTRIRNVPLLLYLALAAATAGIIVYAYDGYLPIGDTVYIGGLGALVVGALVFAVTLPSVQSRVGNVSHLVIVMIGAAALGSMYFAAGYDEAPGSQGAISAVASHIQAAPPEVMTSAAVQNIDFSTMFYAEVFWVLLICAAVFLAALPRVWSRFMRYISFDQGVKALSYTGIFIVAVSILIMGALFLASDMALWKFGVWVVAALVGARFAWHFLGNYRQVSGVRKKSIANGEPESVRQMMGVK